MTTLRAVIACLLLSVVAVSAQPSYPPPNDVPHPFLPGASWGQLPEGRKWGATAGVDVAPDGSIWAYDRCGGNQNGCAASSLTPILHFDASGRVVRAFGANMFNFPHGFHLDRDGNVWVTDHGMTPANGKGQAVYKFSPDGKLLLTLGKPGVAGDRPDTFNQPSDVFVAPNGDIFVADGHAPGPAARIVKFDRTGKFVKSWGSLGAGDEQLNGPHALAMDSQGRLFVGDRSNNRVQVFDQDGQLLASWKQFGRPSGIFIDRDDVMYVTDSESRSDSKPGQYGHNPGVTRGIRIGSVKDGKVTAFIPDPAPIGISSTSEGVAVDRAGNVFGAEVAPRDMKKYVKAPPFQTRVPAEGGDITITALMHGSVQVEYAGKVIHVDPAMGDLAKAAKADLVLVTDEHDDHLSVSGLAQVRKPGAPVVAPAAVDKRAAGRVPAPIEVMANGQTRTVAGVSIRTVPMYNLERKIGDEPFHMKGRGNGYVIALGGKRLYFAGDTECVPEIKALRNIDVAFLPMNLPFTMAPSEAAACAKVFKPKVAIPYHFQGQRTDDFSAALAGTGVDVRTLNWYPIVFHPDAIAVARPGAMVDVGGRKIHMHCVGTGQPTVVLESGSGAFALDWHFVHSEVAKTTRVCSYDRAGYGWSDPATGSENTEGVVTDLHAALSAAGEKPPYLLVGASVGGMFARGYQLRYPAEVAGLVFVDAAHEDSFMIPVNGKPAPIWSVSAEDLRTTIEMFAAQQGNMPPPPAPPLSTGAPFNTLPTAVLITRITFESRRHKVMAANRPDMAAMIESERAAAVKLHEASAGQAPPLGDRPVVVLTAEHGQEPQSKALQSKLAQLSTNTSHRTVAASGHEIHLYQPRAVIQAIEDTIESARRGSKVSAR